MCCFFFFNFFFSNFVHTHIDGFPKNQILSFCDGKSYCLFVSLCSFARMVFFLNSLNALSFDNEWVFRKENVIELSHKRGAK